MDEVFIKQLTEPEVLEIIKDYARGDRAIKKLVLVTKGNPEALARRVVLFAKDNNIKVGSVMRPHELTNKSIALANLEQATKALIFKGKIQECLCITICGYDEYANFKSKTYLDKGGFTIELDSNYEFKFTEVRCNKLSPEVEDIVINGHVVNVNENTFNVQSMVIPHDVTGNCKGFDLVNVKTLYDGTTCNKFLNILLRIVNTQGVFYLVADGYGHTTVLNIEQLSDMIDSIGSKNICKNFYIQNRDGKKVMVIPSFSEKTIYLL